MRAQWKLEIQILESCIFHITRHLYTYMYVYKNMTLIHIYINMTLIYIHTYIHICVYIPDEGTVEAREDPKSRIIEFKKSTPSGDLVAVRPGDLEPGYPDPGDLESEYPGDSELDPNPGDPNDPDLDLGVLLPGDSVPDPGDLEPGYPDPGDLLPGEPGLDMGVKFSEKDIFLSLIFISSIKLIFLELFLLVFLLLSPISMLGFL
jgi:hypothetical protein